MAVYVVNPGVGLGYPGIGWGRGIGISNLGYGGILGRGIVGGLGYRSIGVPIGGVSTSWDRRAIGVPIGLGYGSVLGLGNVGYGLTYLKK